MDSCCALLRSRSSYSLKRGTASPAALVAAVRAAGYDTLALTDRNNLYAAVPFVRHAVAAGLAPILGVEIDAPGAARCDGGPVAGDGAWVVALARGARGYASLCRLITRRQLDPEFALGPALGAEAADLHVLAADPALLVALRAVLPPDRLAILVAVGSGDPARDRAALARGRALERALALPAVAAPGLFAVDPAGPARARLLSAVREGALVDAVPPAGLAPSLAPARALAAAGAEDLVARGRAIAADCRAPLPMGERIFPAPPLAPGASAAAALRERCLAGLVRRYGALLPAPLARLERELAVIAERGFLAYFLVVGDIVAAARAAQVAVVGRGSGASSIVAYVLGITNVDPIAHRLHFERFLSAARADDLPDLDVDLDWRGRDQVIEEVYRAYGAEHVAMISTHAAYHPRSAFRDAARAHGVPVAEVNRLARRLPHALSAGTDLAAFVHASPELRREPWDAPPWPAILAGATSLLDLPRHLGIHPGGIVIADRPLAELVPLERATKGIVVTQYEMEAIEAIGLVKIDLLGNRALSTVAEAAALVAAASGGGSAIAALDRVADEDPATARLLATGDTLGCFQIESPGMRHLLAMLVPSCVRDVVDALALIRPGPASSGMKEHFVRRARGLEPARFAHPALVPVLALTHGIPLYEEDVMSMADAVAGIGLDQGDGLRRAIAAASGEEEAMRTLRHGFVTRAVAQGVDPDSAGEVWEAMARFAAYSFSRAHAAGYGVLAYQSAALKAHHPAAFACAVLNHHQGMYPRWVHVEDARRHGIRLRLPCVNRSAIDYVLEPAAEDGNDGVRAIAVRTGLGQVLGLAERSMEAIGRARERDGPFVSLADFRRRVAMSAPELHTLIRVGAADALGQPRARLLWEALALKLPATALSAPGGPELFPAAVGEGRGPALRELSPERMLADEWTGLGIAPRAHPLFTLAPDWAAAVVAPRMVREAESAARFGGALRIGAGTLASHLGETVLVGGLVAASRHTPTRRGEPMAFLTLDDPTGTAECTLFPAALARAGPAFAARGPLWALGRADVQYGAVSLTVERLGRLAH